MSDTARIGQPDLMLGWLHTEQARSRLRGHRPPAVVGPLRFAFYGRISTGEYQDAASSRAWQVDSAHQAIAGRGRIVAEYFDIGCSRRLSWSERPQAAALLAAVADPARGFDAVVVGEYERAFHGDQLIHVATIMAAQGDQAGVGESLGGGVDLVGGLLR